MSGFFLKRTKKQNKTNMESKLLGGKVGSFDRSIEQQRWIVLNHCHIVDCRKNENVNNKTGFFREKNKQTKKTY